MSTHISDHAIYRNAWTTPDLTALFNGAAQIGGWIEVMVVLAETEAEFGLIPSAPVKRLAAACQGVVIDAALLAEVRDDFERTNHSLLGLIRALQRRCPDDSGEWLCYGATVQDISDTHTARVLSQVEHIFGKRLAKIADTLGALALRYRDAVMCGRTHGQPGLPITFGFKAAGWLDEMQRHRQRLSETTKRLGVGQLGGGVGSLSAFGPDGLALQQRFFQKLGLSSPAISWTAARDRLAEWLNLLALMTATADRIGHEVYNLQRPEIGELSEGFVPGTVGSITMPQKRNPEISEHLGTLARTVRHLAAQMMENLVHDHERDGRSWKSEWAILPTACQAADKSLVLLDELLRNLDVKPDRMLANLKSTEGLVSAERIMLALAPAMGKQSAHNLVYQVAMDAQTRGVALRDAVLAHPQIVATLGRDEMDALFDLRQSTGCCGEMVDRVTANPPEHATPEVEEAGHHGRRSSR